jgi:hypothetical protein
VKAKSIPPVNAANAEQYRAFVAQKSFAVAPIV